MRWRNPQAGYVNVLRMQDAGTDQQSLDVDAANQRYLDAKAQMEAAKAALFDVCAARVRAGLDTPDTLAKPRTAFTAVTIRKALRERGVNALPPGRKRT